MNTITLDFETYYSNDFTLRKLNTYEYIRDDRFKVHGVGIKIDDQPTEWWDNEIEGKLKALPWDTHCVIAHNYYFDGSILFERFNISPTFMLDTLSMARMLMPRNTKLDLNSIANRFGLGAKIHGVLTNTKNIRDLDQSQLNILGKYCKQDVELTYALFKILINEVPKTEQELISLTLRLATQPKLVLNKDQCELAIKLSKEEQESAIRESKVDKQILSSNPKFTAYLESLGVDVPTKTSPRTGKDIPALGQSDPDYIQLVASRPDLNHIWAGREAAKSNIAYTRACRWEYLRTHGSCRMIMPMNYWGAHTGRWSGMDGINVQNLPRKSLLRTAIEAPEGYQVLVADSSQIELRINAWFCEQRDALDLLRNKQCLYRKMACELFKVNMEDVLPTMRQLGKVVVLGCGYGMGWRRFKSYCASGPLGMEPKQLTDDEAKYIIDIYRNSNQNVVNMWRKLDDVIKVLALRQTDTQFKCVTLKFEEIQLPSGASLLYRLLEQQEEGSWMYGKKYFLWGGTLLENIIQALARQVIAEQMLAVDKLDNVDVVGCTHDEIIALCPTELAEQRFNEIIGIMSTPPEWAPDLPLGAEGGWARNYSK